MTKMRLEKIKQAIEEKKEIEFFYDGKQRIVEPYLIGNTTTGKQTLRAYQTAGYSDSKVPGWKLFTLEKVSQVEIVEKHFEKQSDYKPNDKGMISILCRVE